MYFLRGLMFSYFPYLLLVVFPINASASCEDSPHWCRFGAESSSIASKTSGRPRAAPGPDAS